MQAPELTLGEHLARARRQAGMSQSELALMLGVSRPTLGKWERDQSEPTVKQFARLIEATGALWLLEVSGLSVPADGEKRSSFRNPGFLLDARESIEVHSTSHAA